MEELKQKTFIQGVENTDREEELKEQGFNPFIKLRA